VQDVREKVQIVPDRGAANVELVFDPPWNQTMNVGRGPASNRHDVGPSMKWIAAGPAESLSDGETRSFALGRRMIAVARSGEAYFAFDDVCTHDGAETHRRRHRRR